MTVHPFDEPEAIPRLALTPAGVEEVEPVVGGDHLLLDRHWEAVAWFFATGDARPVACFARVAVLCGLPLAVRPDQLCAWPALARASRGDRS